MRIEQVNSVAPRSKKTDRSNLSATSRASSSMHAASLVVSQLQSKSLEKPSKQHSKVTRNDFLDSLRSSRRTRSFTLRPPSVLKTISITFVTNSEHFPVKIILVLKDVNDLKCNNFSGYWTELLIQNFIFLTSYFFHVLKLFRCS